MAQGRPDACEQLVQLLDSPEGSIRLYAIQWPKGRQFQCFVVNPRRVPAAREGEGGDRAEPVSAVRGVRVLVAFQGPRRPPA